MEYALPQNRIYLAAKRQKKMSLLIRKYAYTEE